MKSYPLLASSLYLEPWLLMPGTHASLSEQFRAHCEGAGLQNYQAANDPVGPVIVDRRSGERILTHPQIEVYDGVALVTIEGIIGRKLSSFEMMCGGYDIALLESQMRLIADDDSIRAVVIDFDTPGGRAAGVEQAALAIRECADSGKRIYGWSEGTCASAGYFLAAACDVLYGHNDSIWGSISTICAGVDSSRAWEMQGLELKLVATGPLKALGQPGKRWSEEEMQFLRDRAEVVDVVFKDFVRARRGMGEEGMNGGHWYARKAPDRLIDGTRKTLEEVIGEAWAYRPA